MTVRQNSQDNQDSQDKEFGATAAADQELVDELEDQGVGIDQLPDTPASGPRAAGKAEPAGE